MGILCNVFLLLLLCIVQFWKSVPLRLFLGMRLHSSWLVPSSCFVVSHFSLENYTFYRVHCALCVPHIMIRYHLMSARTTSKMLFWWRNKINTRFRNFFFFSWFFSRYQFACFMIFYLFIQPKNRQLVNWHQIRLESSGNWLMSVLSTLRKTSQPATVDQSACSHAYFYASHLPFIDWCTPAALNVGFGASANVEQKCSVCSFWMLWRSKRFVCAPKGILGQKQNLHRLRSIRFGLMMMHLCARTPIFNAHTLNIYKRVHGAAAVAAFCIHTCAPRNVTAPPEERLTSMVYSVFFEPL